MKPKQLINEVFDALRYGCCNSYQWGKYTQTIKDDEKQHRSFAPDGVRHGLTITEATKLFAADRLLRALYAPKELIKPNATDFFTVRTDIFMAWGLVGHRDYARGMRAEMKTLTKRLGYSGVRALVTDWLSRVDYADLMKGERA